VTVDALRADALTPELMPSLHGLAERSAVFERAYPPASMTGGTTLSMFAGRSLSDLNAKNVYRDRKVVVEGTFTQAFEQAG
jgi:membrane-anchored protein YejM (alkaline phosphatase superfamily)